MRTRRLFAALGLALLLSLSPAAVAQEDASLSVDAFSGDRPLSEASPLEPGDPISVTANATTPDDGREWQLTVSASFGQEDNGSAVADWEGQSTGEQSVSSTAPQENGTYVVEWNVTLEARETEADEWTVEQTDEGRESYSVQQRAQAPSEEDVSVDVRTGDGGTIHELGNVTPNQGILLEADVDFPDRERIQWNVTARVFLDDVRVASGQQQTSGGSVSFPLQFNAPGEEGATDLRWEVVVEYRDEADEAWTPLTTQEDTATFAVEPLAPPPDPGIPWLWILIAGAVVVGGGAGAYYLFRPPKQIKGEPRSQAMQDLEGGAASAEPEEPEVHPQVKILEARAEDLRRMIELARQRYEEGEITEHQFEQIKQRKEADLEEVEEEIEAYRQEGGQ